MIDWPFTGEQVWHGLETLVMALSSAALLRHGLGQLAGYFADRDKPDARTNRLSRRYPHSYKDPRRWRLRGLGGATTLLLGVALLIITLNRYGRF